MKVLLRFFEMNNPENVDTFYVNISDAPEGADKTQEDRIESLGFVQSAMMSARKRKAWLFNGYEYLDVIPGVANNTVLLVADTWKQLVADDFWNQ